MESIQNMFSSENPSEAELEEVIRTMLTCVTDEMNERLLENYTTEEVWALSILPWSTIFSWHSDGNLLRDFLNVVTHKPPTPPTQIMWTAPNAEVMKNMVKLWAAKLVVNICCRFLWTHYVIEGDYLKVVQKLNSTVEDLPDVGSILQNARSRTPVARNFTCKFVWRAANMAAHELAKITFSFQEGWEPPASLYEHLRVETPN
ncbi:hypothetical protein Salat_2510100 [Sesamum alatum]|uniref:RNase H type-1 domain-containing protein n=1 Tax=Sesamum alatum TaxID=300844 RepID=A0AAE1XRW7_9LAMI|nr:hypothetical protein Salat_2510100 [Sesamum alatum]